MGNKTATWNAAFNASPAGSDNLNAADDKMREDRLAVQERLNEEHFMGTTDAQNDQGVHKEGTARAYVRGAFPTVRQDGTSFFKTATDMGKLCVRTTDGAMNVLLTANGSGTDVWGEVKANGSTGDFTVGGDLLVSTDGVITRDLSVGRNIITADTFEFAGFTLYRKSFLATETYADMYDYFMANLADHQKASIFMASSDIFGEYHINYFYRRDLTITAFFTPWVESYIISHIKTLTFPSAPYSIIASDCRQVYDGTGSAPTNSYTSTVRSVALGIPVDFIYYKAD